MAKVLKDHAFSGRGGSGSKYDKYLDGRVHKLKLGEDCSENATSARTYFYGLGNRRGMDVHTDLVSYPGFIVIQAEPKADA